MKAHKILVIFRTLVFMIVTGFFFKSTNRTELFKYLFESGPNTTAALLVKNYLYCKMIENSILLIGTAIKREKI